jgi:hypothetical protein
MRDLLILVVHIITTVFRLAQPGGLRAVVAESVLTKHQMLILNRSRRRAPNLRIQDRFIAGLCSLWIKPSRHRKVVAFKTSTLLSFHRALVQRKYRLLFSPTQRTKPGPKGPAGDLIHAVVAMKKRNSTWGCPKIADHINLNRTHAALNGTTPIETTEAKGLDLKSYRWQTHCRGLYQTPIAA